MKLLAVYTTVATEDEARAMARALVERELAACAQFWPIESVYRWKGAVEEGREYRLLFKTTEAQYAAVEAAIRERHAYELPAIHAVPVEAAYAPYAAWVEAGSGGR
jgi:periplasmic divalent cation tolerance protein